MHAVAHAQAHIQTRGHVYKPDKKRSESGVNRKNKQSKDTKERESPLSSYNIIVSHCSHLLQSFGCSALYLKEITYPIAEEEIDSLCCMISNHIREEIVVIPETDFN